MLKMIAPTGLAVALLAGCTSGQSEFSCKGYPDGVSCLSARKVYELTNSRSRVTEDDLADHSGDRGPAIEGVLRPLPSTDAHQGLAPPEGAEPADGVMRVWVAPWTRGGDVTAPTYVYSEVGADDQVGGDVIERRFEPLSGQSTPVQAAAGRPFEPGDVVVTKAAPAVAKVEPEAEPRRLDGKPSHSVRLAEIYFESGKTLVSDAGKLRLRFVADRLASLKPRQVLIVGFTDHVGSTEANLRLAQKRIDAVTEVLKQAGVTTAMSGYAQGEAKPLADGAPAADPNQRKVWVMALDVPKIPKAAAKASVPAKQTDPKAEVVAAKTVKRKSLRRDPDDHGDHSDRGHHDRPSMH